jgi:putative redox protein
MKKSVTFSNARGETLSGIVHASERAGSSRGVVLCHGMESHKSSAKIVAMSRFLSLHGFTALRFDFAGSGASRGSFAEISYSRQADDLRAAVGYLANLGVTRVGLIGSSMGGSVALLYAGAAGQIAPVAGVATIAAPSDPLEMVRQFAAEGRIKAWETEGFTEYHGRRINRTLLDDMRALDILGAAQRIRCPVLVIHGDADRTVPVDQAYRLYGALETEKELLILRGADHRLSDPEHMAAAVDAAQNWIRRCAGES